MRTILKREISFQNKTIRFHRYLLIAKMLIHLSYYLLILTIGTFIPINVVHLMKIKTDEFKKKTKESQFWKREI